MSFLSPIPEFTSEDLKKFDKIHKKYFKFYCMDIKTFTEPGKDYEEVVELFKILKQQLFPYYYRDTCDNKTIKNIILTKVLEYPTICFCFDSNKYPYIFFIKKSNSINESFSPISMQVVELTEEKGIYRLTGDFECNSSNIYDNQNPSEYFSGLIETFGADIDMLLVVKCLEKLYSPYDY